MAMIDAFTRVKKHDLEFTFDWVIENFSFCASQKSGFLDSPVFRISLGKKSNFHLRIYPETLRNPIKTKCLLWRLKDETNTDSSKFDVSVEISIPKMFKLHQTHCNVYLDSRCSALVFQNFIQQFFSEEQIPVTEFPDFLTVKFTVWQLPAMGVQNPWNKCFPMQLMSYDFEDMSSINTSIEDKFVPTCKPFHSISHTEVNVTEKTLTWRVVNFQEWKVECKRSVHLESALEDPYPLIITLYKSKESENNLGLIAEIQRDHLYSYSDLLIAKCRIVAEGQFGDVPIIKGKTHCFDGDPWRLDLLISKWTEESVIILSEGGDLTLRFEIGLSLENTEHLTKHTEFLWKRPSMNQLQVFKKNMLNLYKDETYSDITLEIPNKRAFHCDKNVLSARSEIFAERIRNNDTPLLKIMDVDEVTLDRLLTFVYSAVLEDLDITCLLKLYSAASIYKIPSLVQSCKQRIRWMITENNVKSISDEAAKHEDSALAEWVEEYKNLLNLDF